MKEKTVEVNCIPCKEWKIEKDKKITVSLVAPATRPDMFKEYPVIMVFNEKIKSWEACPLIEYKKPCPICKTMMLVRAIAGTTWLACCSHDCYELYFKRKKEEGK
jgi:hypothetical protein